MAVLVGLVSPVASASPARAARGGPASGQVAETGFSTQIEPGPVSDGAESRHVLAAAAQSPVPCASLSPKRDRFKDTGLVDCLRYSSQHINGADFRVYYPVEWDPNGGWGSGYLEPAAEALERSAKVYGKLGLMANVNVVFSLLNQDNGTAYANAGLDLLTSEQPCVVAIFTPSAQLSVEVFQQIVAHELFHCFQYWNLDPQMHAGSSARKWWVEGSAEYFGNVVYPNVNEEWDRIAEFDDRSPTTPLTKLTYPNTVFFQYLANKVGNEGVIGFLASLATSGGTEAQERALRAYPGFADLFQDFAQSYLDKQIADTGGGMLPLNPVIEPANPTIAGSTRLELQADPFVVYRLAPVFDAGDAYAIDTERSDEPGGLGARVHPGAGSWNGTLPATIDCSDPHEFLLAITVIDAAPEDSTTVTFNIAAADAKCKKTDACLMGVWKATDVQAYFDAAYPAVNPDMQLTYSGIEGSLFYTFDADAVTVSARDFQILAKADLAGFEADFIVAMDGDATAPYRTDGHGGGEADLVTNTIVMTATVFLNGEGIVSNSVNELAPVIGGRFEYSCKGKTLKLSLITPDGQKLPPMTLKHQ